MSSRFRHRFRPMLELLEVRETPAVTVGYALGLGDFGSDEGKNMTTDAVGNLYVVGDFSGTIDFDPGPGTANLNGGGAFIVKFSPAGTLLWARGLGPIVGGEGIAVDAAGNVYTTGNYFGTPDMDPGPGTFTLPSGSGDIFVSKLDSSGNFVWAVSLDGTAASLGRQLGVDAGGNVYVSGFINGTVDFDPGAGTFNLSGTNYDLFACKLDSAGAFNWAFSIPGTQALNAHGFAVDPAGNVYASASYDRPIDADPGPGVLSFTTSNRDPLLLKLDTTGNLIWAQHFGFSFGGGFGGAVALDAGGNIFTTGYFVGPMDFDPGPGTFTLTDRGGYDAYVVKLDSTGNFLWAVQLGGTAYEEPRGLAVGPDDELYITGSFDSSPADFDPGPGTFDLTSNGSDDAFLCRLDASGNFRFALGFGGTSNDRGHAVAVDPFGNFYATGYFRLTADFDPGPGTYNLTSTGGDDIFITSLLASSVTITPSGSSTDVGEGGATDTYTVVLDAQPLADVIVTLTPDSQLTASVATLTFTTINWNIPQSVTVTAVNDVANEGNHTGLVSHTTSSSDAFYNGIAVPRLTAAIADNDAGGVTIVPSGGSTDVAESGGTDTYTVVLTFAPTANVTITMNTGAQVTATPVSLLFTPANWNTPQTVTVAAVDDALYENNHTGVIAHAASSTDLNYSGLAIASVTANITDNEQPPGVTFVPTGGSTVATEGGAGDTVTVVLDLAPTANVVLTLNPGTQVSVVPATLTFTTGNWNVAQTVAIAAVNDPVAEGSHTGVLTTSATSADPLYNGLTVLPLTVNITDNDTAGVTITHSGGSTGIAEGGAGDGYLVVLDTQPTATVVVNLAGGTQATLTPTRLTFTPANWNLAQAVTVAAIDDATYEGPHAASLTHAFTSTDTFYGSLAIVTIVANITDNDLPPTVLITKTNGSIAVLEGASQSYTVVLSTAPLANVVVTPAGDSQVSLSATALTFTPGNWRTPQPVIVTALPDGVVEGPHVGRISHSVASTDPGYNGISLAPVAADIVDSDGLVIAGTDKADKIVVTFTATQIQVSINNKITLLPATASQAVILAGGGADHVEIIDPSVPFVVQGGLGVDRLFVNGRAGFNDFVLGAGSIAVNSVGVGVWDVENLIVGGRAGNDSFTVTDVPAFATELKGDLGNDSITGPDRGNVWQITTVNGGTLDNTIKLNGVEAWIGGGAADTFRFSPGKTLARIDGGGGNDMLDHSLATAAVTVNLQSATATGVATFANITRFVGGKNGADKLIGADQSNAWNISAANAGDVNGIAFASMENLTGGAFDDTFSFADGQSVRGKIDGGGGSDLLDYTSYLTKPVAINLQTKTATGTGGFLNLEQFQGGAGLADTLIGMNQNSIWALSAPGTGSVNGLSFLDFENFTGGSLVDTFALSGSGDWLGTLNGGGGKDVLTANPAQSNVWVSLSLTSGTLNTRKFLGVESRR